MDLYAVFLLIILGAILGILGWKYFLDLKLRKRMEKARISERGAVSLLKKHGFDIVDVQKEASYEVFVNGKPHKVTVRADVIVKKDGKIYVAEIKSGKTSPSLNTSATRRQLLEYYLVYKPAGLILVDMEQRKIKTVEYSILKRDYFQVRYLFYAVVIFFIGFIMGFLTRGE
ncbi:PD-(D/E)XK nuclease family protein [Thermosediminibacter oceani]|uniref:PD-(D/E)XK endonuclease-like domain-containing protein n=1 Tax=Thermosediminibacter oceani (strain ATCC BAA-1034 / DSM 16646 / JW/IW-1228P) TaxID=555079 RepID=D9S3T3_THEOJ|nr:PD-(D/E)XK nuclease family protein [Thermosediminibacter oceani]ADL08060.1 hypothetical protein Toce_1305 [Thermosediminibacter oceani DSM 16646]